jgi:hypothetical protein
VFDIHIWKHFARGPTTGSLMSTASRRFNPGESVSPSNPPFSLVSSSYNYYDYYCCYNYYYFTLLTVAHVLAQQGTVALILVIVGGLVVSRSCTDEAPVVQAVRC